MAKKPRSQRRKKGNAGFDNDGDNDNTGTGGGVDGGGGQAEFLSDQHTIADSASQGTNLSQLLEDDFSGTFNLLR